MFPKQFLSVIFNLFTSSTIARSALKIAANVVVVVAYILLASACYRHFRATGSVNWVGQLVTNSLMICMYIARRDAKKIASSPLLWILAFAGTVAPLFMRPTDSIGFSIVGNCVQAVGLVLIAAAMLSLGRSFGIVPANRGIRQSGLYLLVRHPLYCAELLALLGVLIANLSALNAIIWVADVILQFRRARAEEQFLVSDPIYREYTTRVRFRLIPGLL